MLDLLKPLPVKKRICEKCQPSNEKGGKVEIKRAEQSGGVSAPPKGKKC
jgi:hypothetical protein